MALTPQENAAVYAAYTQGYNNVTLAVDNHNIASGGADIEDGVMQHAAYGIGTSLTSAAVGMFNSVKALGNLAGADMPMTDTREVVHEVFGDEASAYYARNKLGVDIAGMVGSTLAVGLGAVGALRAAQARGVLSAGFQNATGLRNADIVLGSAQTMAARQAVLSNATQFSWNNRSTWAAIGWGFRQNVQEALVAEAAWHLTHNQNEVINPEHVSAWESISNNATDGLPFLIGGAVLGTAIDAARIGGSLRSAYNAAESVPETAALKSVISELQTAALAPGDTLTKILHGREAVAQLAELKTEVPQELRKFHAQRVQQAQTELTKLEQDAIIRMNRVEGEYGKQAPLELVQQALASGKADDAVGVLGNATAIRLVTPEEQIAQRTFFTQTAAPTIVSGDVAGAPAAGPSVPLSTLEDYDTLRRINEVRVRGNNAVFTELSKHLEQFSRTRRPAKDNIIVEIADYAASKKNPAFEELLTLIRRDMADPVFSRLEQLGEVRKLERNGLKIGGTVIPPQYAERFASIIVDVATDLQHSKTGLEATTRMPGMTKLLRAANAGALEPYNSSRAFYNLRTGTIRQSAMLLAHDLGDVLEQGGQITIAGTKLAFQYKQDYFAARNLLSRIAGFGVEHSDDPFLEASALWAAAAKRPLPQQLGNSFVVQATDLPTVERVAAEMRAEQRITLRTATGEADRVLTRDQAVAYIDEAKASLRQELQLAGLTDAQIAALLNVDEAFAMGVKNTDSMLIGKRDFTKPETVAVQYRPYDPKEIEIRARTMSGLSERIKKQQALSAAAAGRVLGPQVFELFPDAPENVLRALRLTEQRATLVTSAQSEFGGAREFFSYVGRLVHQTIDARRQQIETDMHGFYQSLTQREKYAERAQLALFENLARTHDYRLMHLPQADGTIALHAVRDDAYLEVQKAVQEAMSVSARKAVNSTSVNSQPEINRVAEKMLAAQMFSMIEQKRAIKFLPDVADVVQYKNRMNQQFIANDKAIAQALGKHITRHPDVYYPTPVNLRRTPYVAFVKPKSVHARDNDAASYMLYAESDEVLQQKIRIAQERYGARFDIVTQKDVSAYKQMKGEYEEGKVFNEWDFDKDLQRLGKAGNLLPSIDVDAVESLDLIRNWMHRRGEQQIRAAVELRYSDVVQGLRYADAAADAVASPLPGVRKEAYTMYKDSLRTMMSARSYSGWMEGMYRDVNGIVGEYASKALDAAANAIRSIRSTRGFDQARMDAITAELDKLGVEMPYKTAFDALTASEVVSDGRTLASLSRMLNTLVAGSTLRLDFMNSFLQAVSTPILGLGVIREAKMALRGTDAGARLLDMTTVLNPANGAREPTATKLLSTGIRNVFVRNEATMELAEALRKRGVLADYTRQYLEAHDFSSLNGRHTIQQLQQKIDNIMDKGGKITGHMLAEDMSRLWIADAVRQIGEVRGLSKEEIYRAAANAVDKVHGIYRAHSRVQLFNGVIGQSIGLFQTYMFNFGQYMFRSIGDRGRREAAIMLGMQSAIFGVRSLPGFGQFNAAVAATNSAGIDVYSMAGTDADPTGLTSYALYGLGSSFLLPTDLYSRGDMVLRHATVVPTDLADLPAVGIISKATANLVDTIGAMADANSTDELLSAAVHGLAHNGLNRPLQGLGVWAQGSITTNQAVPLLQNVNYTDYDRSEGLNAVAIATRVLGAKPRDEAILLDAYYRRTAYQTAQNLKLKELGENVRTLALRTGEIDDDSVAELLDDYKDAGGTVENFNAFMVRNLGIARKQGVEEFARKMSAGNTAAARSYNAWMLERGGEPNWQLDSMLVRDGADTTIGGALQDVEAE